MPLQSIKKSAMFLFIIATIYSCNSGLTLQTYYVDNELKPGFTSFDIPTSFINVEKVELTDQQSDAYKSVDKLNILAFMKDESNEDLHKVEFEKVKLILENPKYEELIRGGNSEDGKFIVKFLGDIDNIDELIVLVNANDKGFAIARILGDNMNANNLMSLRTVLTDAKIEDSQLNQITNFFK